MMLTNNPPINKKLTAKVVSPPIDVDTLEGALPGVVSKGLTETDLGVGVGFSWTVTHVLDTTGVRFSCKLWDCLTTLDS